MKSRIYVTGMILLLLWTSVSRAIKIACVGDSITEGANISDLQNRYPAQLQRALAANDNTQTWEMENFGVSGATLLNHGDRPYMQETRYQQALAWQPDKVVIMLGTNDSKPYNWVYRDEFVADYLALIDSFVNLESRPDIWICKPVPAFTGMFDINNDVIRYEILPLIDEIAEQRDVQVIDVYTPLLNAGAFFPDGIHPNATGAGRMVDVIAPHLKVIRDLPDFNQDGYINFIDYTLLAQRLVVSEVNDINQPPVDLSYDLVPIPAGDGQINDLDMTAMLQYWLTAPHQAAHWTLDDIEDGNSLDLVSHLNAFVRGTAQWQPVGQYGGGLELNGEGYLETEFVLDPADGPFTIFIWIKGGQPGQVLMSQTRAQRWIYIDTATGGLRSNLLDTGRQTRALISPIPLPDDNDWHLVRFVWDGMRRYFFLDDVQVAADTQSLQSLLSSRNGLYFGAGIHLESDSFWTGSLDDIRIYTRALLPK